MPCQRCGKDHDIFACPQVKAITLDENQNIVRVDFLTPLDYPSTKEPEAVPTYETLKPSKEV